MAFGVRKRDEVILAIFQPGFVERFFVGAHAGGGYIKESQNAGSHRACISFGLFAKYVRSHRAALLVRRPCQGNHGWRAHDIILHADNISHRINIGVGCLHVLIHQNAATFAETQAGFFGQFVVGAHADGKHNHIRFKRLAITEHYFLPIFRHARKGFAQLQRDAIFRHVVFDQFGHIAIQWGHDLIRHLDDGYF